MSIPTHHSLPFAPSLLPPEEHYSPRIYCTLGGAQEYIITCTALFMYCILLSVQLR